tara:strand:- start:4502 stop:4933 length:432 start_codon:yes stop_codon:yes gene_type:complete
MADTDILKKYNQTNEFGRFLGLVIESSSPGEVKYCVEVKKEHLATLHSAHGGFLAAYFDQIIGTAALSKALIERKVVATVEFKMNYLKPAFLGDKLVGKGKVINNGKRLYTVEGKILNQKQELLATGLATLNAYPFEKSDMNY